MTIEFIPNDFNDRKVKSKLDEAFEKAILLRGAVAFWTIKEGYFKNLTKALKYPDSFYCVDIMSPTNFDSILNIEKTLKTLGKSNTTFFVHNKQYRPNDNKREGLMHSKIILLDMPNVEVELWVGSHNFTDNALIGFNIESSMVLKFKRNDNEKLYNQVVDYLNKIKNSSQSFSEQNYYYFKALQDAAQTLWIKKYLGELLNILLDKEFDEWRTIEIEGDDLLNLEGSTIIVLGKDQKELTKIEGYSKKIIVHAHNKDGSEIFYHARLRASDKIDNKFSKAVEFGKRRIGKKKSMNHTVFLAGEGIVQQKDLEEEGYYVNIEIRDKVPEDKKILVYSYPDFKKLWYEESKDVFVSKSLKVFQQDFLPKLIYEVVNEKITNAKGQLRTFEVYNVTDSWDDVPMFKRRIYLILPIS